MPDSVIVVKIPEYSLVAVSQTDALRYMPPQEVTLFFTDALGR
jgi:hypothetical protein